MVAITLLVKGIRKHLFDDIRAWDFLCAWDSPKSTKVPNLIKFEQQLLINSIKSLPLSIKGHYRSKSTPPSVIINQRCVTLCHCVSLCVIGCHFVLLCVIVCHCLSLCVIVFICVSLCVIECHFVSLCVIVCHCVILCHFVTLCILRAQNLLLSIYWLNCFKVESHFTLLIELISNCCSNLILLGP